VELLELPSQDEGFDNIAAWWVNDNPAKQGDRMQLKYRVHFGANPHRERRLWTVQDSHVKRDGGSLVAEVHYAGARADDGESPISPAATCDARTIDQLHLAAGPDGEQVVRFRHVPSTNDEARLSVHLTRDGTRVSETWQFDWRASTVATQ
jgi:glucans biosynthesis protein